MTFVSGIYLYSCEDVMSSFVNFNMSIYSVITSISQLRQRLRVHQTHIKQGKPGVNNKTRPNPSIHLPVHDISSTSGALPVGLKNPPKKITQRHKSSHKQKGTSRLQKFIKKMEAEPQSNTCTDADRPGQGWIWEEVGEETCAKDGPGLPVSSPPRCLPRYCWIWNEKVSYDMMKEMERRHVRIARERWGGEIGMMMKGA